MVVKANTAHVQDTFDQTLFNPASFRLVGKRGLRSSEPAFRFQSDVQKRGPCTQSRTPPRSEFEAEFEAE